MPVAAAVVGGVASVGGALISVNASNQAAQVQANAAQKAQDTQLQMYNTSRQDLSPYNITGRSAMSSLADLYGLATPDNPNGGQAMSGTALARFQASPDYQFTMNQGLNALDQDAAAKGTLLSGGHTKDVLGYASGLASQQFNNYADRLRSLSGLGESAAAQTGDNAMKTGAAVAGSQLAAGEATASGIMGTAKAINSGISGLGTTLADVASKSAYADTSPLATVTNNSLYY